MATMFWTGVGDGQSWIDPLNWSSSAVPSAQDDVLISDSPGRVVRIASGLQSVHSLTSYATIVLTNATLELSSDSTIDANFTFQNSELTGSGNLILKQTTEWYYGTMSGSGTTSVSFGGTLNFHGGVIARNVDNHGTALWDAGDLNMMGATFQNFGQFTVDTSSTYLLASGIGQGDTNVFLNRGRFIKRGNGWSAYNYVSFNVRMENYGSIDVITGSLGLVGGGRNAAGNGINVLADGELVIGDRFLYDDNSSIHSAAGVALIDGTHVLPSSSVLVAKGLEVNGSVQIGFSISTEVIHIKNFSTLEVTGAVVTNDLLLDGTLKASGDVTISRLMEWRNGTMLGSGTTIIESGAKLNFGGGVIGRNVDNYGTATWSAGDLNMMGATFQNFGQFTVDTSSTYLLASGIGQGDTNVFLNRGRFIKRGNGWSAYNYVSFNVYMENYGSIDVITGSLGLVGGGRNAAGNGINVLADGELVIGDKFLYDAKSVINSAGGVAFEPGTHTLPVGAIVSSGAIQVNGRMILNGPLQSPILVMLRDADISGAGDLIVSKYAEWNGARISGAGAIRVNPSANLVIQTGLPLFLNRTLINRGVVTIGGLGTLSIDQGRLENYGLVKVLECSIQGVYDGASRTLVNAGEIRVTSGGSVGARMQNLLVDNQGVFDLQEGYFAFVECSIQGPGIVRSSPNVPLDVVLGNFWQSSSSNADQFTLEGVTQIISDRGTLPFTLEVMSADRGATPESLNGNFLLGTLTISAGSSVQLSDVHDNALGNGHEALYLDTLVVNENATLDLQSLHVYARVVDIRGSVVGGSVQQLPDGGLIPVNKHASGRITVDGQQDEWSFHGRAGSAVTLSVDPGGPASFPPAQPAILWIEAEIRDPFNNVIASGVSSSASDMVRMLAIQLPMDGIYKIVVRAPGTQPELVGNYHLSLYDASADTYVLPLNQRVIGTIESPLNVDRWSFTANAGQQVQFDLIESTNSAFVFQLRGPNDWVGFTELGGDSPLITLPFAGTYHLEVATLRDAIGSYSMMLKQTAEATLSVGVPFSGKLAGSQSSSLFQVQVAGGERLFIHLDDSVDTDRNQIYVRYAVPPTREDYQFRSSGDAADASVLVPAAAEGTWYILLVSAASSSGTAFTLQADASAIFLTAVSPTKVVRLAETVLTLEGAGFNQDTKVAVVSQSGAEIVATSVTIDTLTQATGRFAAGLLPVGLYTLRVSQTGGQSSELAGALTVSDGSVGGRFFAQLRPPATARFGFISSMSIAYRNDGDTSIAAPLLTIGSDQHALFSANGDNLVQAAWSGSAIADGYSETLQILAQGRTPGILGPGEQVELPIWVKPTVWGELHLSLDTLSADDARPLNWTTRMDQFLVENYVNPAFGSICSGAGCSPDPIQLVETWSFTGTLAELHAHEKWQGDRQAYSWSSIKTTSHFADPLQDRLRPPQMDDELWHALLPNLRQMVGDTWGDYVRSLSAQAEYLGRLGVQVNSVTQLWPFLVQQAVGLTPIASLSSVIDGRIQLPGNDLILERSFAPTLVGRNRMGLFGWGWKLNGIWENTLAVENDTGILVVTDSNGTQRRFQPDVRGGIFAEPGDYAVLKQDDAGYLLREKSGELTHYRTDGRFDYVEDTHGERVQAVYANGRLVGLQHPMGAFTFEYNSVGRLASISDSLGRKTLYGYDAAGEHLIQVTDRAGQVTTYTYDLGSNPVTRHALLTIVAPAAVERAFQYDALGRLASASHCVCADSGGESAGERIAYSYSIGKITSTDALGHHTQLFLDQHGRLIKSVDALSRSYYYVYDGNNNLVRSYDANGQIYDYQYDSRGNLIRSFDPMGVTKYFEYDSPFGDITKVIDGRGNSMAFEYDRQGNLVANVFADGSKEQFTYDSSGDLITKTNRRRETIYQSYDLQGRIVDREFSDGTHQTYSYDAIGRLTLANDASGQTQLDYDTSDRLTRIDYPDGRWVGYRYDNANRRTQLTGSDGYELHYSYDALGRLADVTDKHGAMVQRHTYDAVGRLIRTSRGNGTYETRQYDAAGQVSQLTNFASDGHINSQFNITYDALGWRRTMSTLQGDWKYDY
ncbi:MAG: hypothetical protein IT423_21565, partial [Pirellulaceae bacterium]|nr:hypothetical protein [Pirellulaceae bacterium]